ncbi:ABC transporter ATP-binding protein [Virgisporangium aliadipatigenens]|uniref:ABC transporter ATP-binding protein n=1 Tax=Virgisporangium aliadipatigenens TaxID=741659 RepID=A0A8J3YQ07_9ACTN|nr:ABC transporter ATP-binding protein [Virgisporangium aliadipatigenens]GIJ49291.1 ABC transporter ATP-binding protein [Virgisporangium aliadipatigenens]
MTTVRAEGLSLRFGRTTALDGVSFALSDGVTGLLGPNGAGKTTLLRILATAIPADAGALHVLGNDPRGAAGRLAVRRRLGYLPQNQGFHPHFTAFEFVDYIAILKEIVAGRHEEVRRVLHAVGLDAQRGKKMKALSGGMRQRVGLAAALLGDPAVVILDEPTVGLDPEQRLRLRELVAHIGEGRTVLLSTHQTEDVASVCQRVIVLHQGRIRFDGEPSALAAIAEGRVWSAPSKVDGALAAWRTGGGDYHHIGVPPAGARPVEPSIEDGYLLLLDSSGVPA